MRMRRVLQIMASSSYYMHIQSDIRCEDIRFGSVGLLSVRSGWVRDPHAHMIMGNGGVLIPPHDFKQPSRSNY